MQESTRAGTTATAMTRTTAVLIANPASGSYLQHLHQIEETVAFLRSHDWQVELKLTQAIGDAQRLAREAVAENVQIIIVAGGDGTINEVIQELAGSETALGVIPCGTVNVWAREVGISLDHAGAREVLLNGQIRSVDLGCVNDRYFLLMAGIGLDGEVTHVVERKPVKRLGVIGYLLVGAWLGLGYSAFRAILQTEQHLFKVNALQIIVGNTQLYGGAIKYTWQAQCDDGLLDICVVRKQSVFGRIALTLDFLLGREQRRQWVRYEKCRAVKVRTRRPVAIQVDGDPMGYTVSTASARESTIFTVAPGALKVLVPQELPEGLFSTKLSSPRI